MTSKIHRRKARRCSCRIDGQAPWLTAAFWLLTLCLLLAWQKAGAQLAPAEDFFNGGAQFYISNNVPAALERVESGLKIYPDDAKLKKLEQLLKQQQQQQQQNQQQQNQQNQQQQQKQDQQKNQQQQNQQSSQQNSQDQKKQDEQKQNQQKSDEQKKQEELQKQAAEKNDDKKDQQDQEAQPVKAGQITPEEAKRLLDKEKDDEQLLQLKPQDKPRNPLRPIKDW